MRCNNCGAEVMDGSPSCPNCGAPIMAVNQGFAPAGKSASANPAFDMIVKFGTIAGAALVFLGSFIPKWYVAKVSFMGVSESEGFGLWASDGGILKLWAIILLIVAVGSVCIEYVPAVGDVVKGLPFYQFYLPALGLLAFILGTVNKHVKEVRDAAKMLGSMGSSHYGIAWWFVLIGLIILFAKAVIEMLNNK